jgi:hypothetical protein
MKFFADIEGLPMSIGSRLGTELDNYALVFVALREGPPLRSRLAHVLVEHVEQHDAVRVTEARLSDRPCEH